MNHPEHGTSLLRVRPAAYHLMIPLLIGPPLLIGGMFAVFSPKMTGTGLLMLFFGAGMIWMGTRFIRYKPILMELSERGIMIWSNPEAINVSFSLLRDLFVPWERLERMRFLGFKELRAEHLFLTVGRGPIRPGCIGLTLQMDPLWPPPGTIRAGIIMRNAKPGEIYLRTADCSPGGRKLWSEMAALARKYAGAHVVDHQSS